MLVTTSRRQAPGVPAALQKAAKSGYLKPRWKSWMLNERCESGSTTGYQWFMHVCLSNDSLVDSVVEHSI